MRALRFPCALAASLALVAQQVPNEQTFRTTVNVVVAPTTVTDPGGQFVSGLSAKDFRLFDKGELQDIKVDVSFLPISLVVAVQADADAESVLSKVQKIGPMLKPLVFGEQGEAAIVSFDSRIQTVQDFTSDPDLIAAGLQKIKAGSSTSRMIDSVFHSVRMLRSRPGDRRRVILLISESRDKSSEGRLREALAFAEFQNVSIYPVVIPQLVKALTARTPAPRPDPIPASAHHVPAGAPRTPDSTSGMRNYGNVMPAFEEIFRGVKSIFVSNPVEVFAKYTAGKEYSFTTQRGLEEAVSDIGAELHSQYLISYSPTTKSEGGYHEIKVDIPGRPDVKIRTRPGYWLASVPN